MTREQANNPDLVRGFKCGENGPVYLGLMTRAEVRELQLKSNCAVWHQAKVTCNVV